VNLAAVQLIRPTSYSPDPETTIRAIAKCQSLVPLMSPKSLGLRRLVLKTLTIISPGVARGSDVLVAGVGGVEESEAELLVLEYTKGAKVRRGYTGYHHHQGTMTARVTAPDLPLYPSTC
jgi:hypothetical protein